MLYLLILCFLSCTGAPSSLSSPWQDIASRDEAHLTGQIIRYPTYRARVPEHWERQDPKESESIVDTTKPLCTFFVEGCKITVHNFPSDSWEGRIPAEAQVLRWEQQFQRLDTSKKNAFCPWRLCRP